MIAVDGPSGSGKSTVARALARRLGLRYLDTGAMYRALTWAARTGGVDTTDAGRLTELARTFDLAIGTDPDDPLVRVDGHDVTTSIRDRAVERDVSAVSAVGEIRAAMVARQRAIAAGGDIVVEGRDIGSVVLPGAVPKIFLTADDRVRAERRSRDPAALAAAPGEPDVGRTHAELARRDRLDAGRAIAPLRPADDAVVLDTSTMNVDAVVERVLGLATKSARSEASR